MSGFNWLAASLRNLKHVVGSTSSSGTGAGTSVLQSRFLGTSGGIVADLPQKPKRPLTPYFRFIGEARTGVVKENPNLKPTEIMKLLGKKWEGLGESARSKFASGFREEMEDYNALMKTYHKSLNPEQRQAVQESKIQQQVRKDKRERKRRLRELGKPTKPPSPFLQYLQSKISSGSGTRTREEILQMSKSCAEQWKVLDETDKGKWISKYHKELEAYGLALVKWEEKMVKEGNEDVVRMKSLNSVKKSAASAEKVVKPPKV